MNRRDLVALPTNDLMVTADVNSSSPMSEDLQHDVDGCWQVASRKQLKKEG